MPKVNNSLVGCGIKNRMDAITTEAKTYFAMFFHGIFSLTILRIMTYKTRNIAERRARALNRAKPEYCSLISLFVKVFHLHVV